MRSLYCRALPTLCRYLVLASALCGAAYQVAAQDLIVTEAAPVKSTRLHVFVIHGWDVLDLAKLRDLTHCCKEWGFPNTCLRTCLERRTIVQEAAAIRAGQPDAEFAFIGFSAGATVARNAACELHREYGIDVKLIIYLGGNFLGWHKTNCPDFVGKVVHIRSFDDCFLAPKIDGAEMHTIGPSWHFSAPSHPRTRNIIQENLLETGCEPVSGSGEAPKSLPAGPAK